MKTLKLFLIALVLCIPSISKSFTLGFDPPAKIKNNTKIFYNHIGSPSFFLQYEVKTYIKEAIQKWTNVCNVPIEFEGTTEAETMEDDNTFVIGWDTNDFFADAYVRGVSQPNQYGSWIITDADMALDPTKINSIAALKALLVHEMGHILGLGHTFEHNQVMSGVPWSPYSGYSTPQWDDIQGCRSLYGRP